MLTKNEERILNLLKENPFLSQKEIADSLGINRSTVATLISALTDKHYIMGRAYVLNQAAEVISIGAMNVDRKFMLKGSLKLGTSNPITSSQTLGGVARNVSENLGRLGCKVSLISLAGKDKEYEWIKDQSSPFVSFQFVRQLEGFATGNYSAILDKTGEMQIGLADMDIYEQMSLSWIQDYYSVLLESRAIVVDLNIPYQVLEYIIRLAKQKNLQLYIVPVSGPKMDHLPKDLEGVDGIIVNLDESQAFFDITDDSKDLHDFADKWLATGVNQVVITQGHHSAIYKDRSGEWIELLPPSVEKVVDVTGAGDAFSAGMIYGWLNGMDSRSSLELAMANANLTITSQDTVCKNLDLTILMQHKHQLF